ncbi:MAG TPA: Hpt domain-containing protein, partial [Polyangiaceae bacterium]|nr:Hpt domain-containing protein [Polyangiaceae bacterium]
MLERVRSTQRLVDAFQTTADPESLRHALGELHTLKGESRMLGLSDISELAHALETELGTAQRFSLALGAFDAMLNALITPGADAGLREALISLQGQPRPTTSLPAPAPSLLPEPSRAPGPPSEPEPQAEKPKAAERFMQVNAALIDSLCERVAELTAAFGQLETNADELFDRGARHTKNAKLVDGFERCRALLDEATSTAWTLRLVPIAPLLE